jgi:hypothetical protein
MVSRLPTPSSRMDDSGDVSSQRQDDTISEIKTSSHESVGHQCHLQASIQVLLASDGVEIQIDGKSQLPENLMVSSISYIHESDERMIMVKEQETVSAL